MKPSLRYQIKLSPSWEVGIRCVYVEVSTKTHTWSNGPIITESQDFCILTPEVKRAVARLSRQYNGIESLHEACEDEQELGVDLMDVRLVMANCKVNRRYLYVSVSNDFMSEADLITYAKEGEQ